MNEKIKKIIINTIAKSNLVNGRIRIKLYNLVGMRIKNNFFGPGCYFSGTELSVGEGSWINFGCSFENHNAKIQIGKNCAVGMGVLFCTSSHEIEGENKRAGKTIYQPIVIEDGCWIGANSTILQGVTIKRGCVIAAGSIVTRDCHPNELYAGIPAKKIKDLK